MKTLHLSIIAILIIGIFVTMCIPSVFAANDTLKLGPPASNMSIQQVNAGENMSSSRSTIHRAYPQVNVTKLMSIAENSTTFKEQINGYAHYSLATVILKPESQNTSNPTMKYNLVYSLYKDPDNYCSYDKVLVITLDVQLQITNTMKYSPYGVPAGYPLPPISCPMNFVPGTMDYNKLAGTIPWSPPLEQLNYGISAENVSCINGLMLVLKSEDGSPACVKPDTVNILIKRGWASSIIVTPPTVQQTFGNNTLPTSFEPCDTPFTQSNNGIAVLYMPANSIGKICVRYSNPNEPKNASLTIFDASSYQTTKSITSWAEPPMIPSGNSTVRYSIKTGNQTGLYGLTIFCSGEPFAVGYDDKSNFTLNDFPWEKSQTISCPMMTYQYKIDSLSGIGVRYIPYP